MTENDFLGFDPQSLSAFNPSEQSKLQGNSLIYRTRPADSISEDKHYRSTIKVVYNVFAPKNSIIEQQSYAMQDENGWFVVVSSLTNNDTSCPIFKAWKKCHYAEKGSTLWKQAAKTEEGGNALFDKRYARYAVIQVLEDKNQPNLVGKYMFWKMPRSVYDVINNKMNPSKESGKASIPVMDFLFGRSIDLEVVPGPGNPGDERYARETKYQCELSEDPVSCINPDGSPLLNSTEQEVLDMYIFKMSKVWKEKNPETRAEMKAAVDSDPNTVELRKIYNEKVIPQIKSVCPNLVEHMGYKEWTPEITARVEKWINTVLAGNNPAIQTVVEAEVVNNVGTASSATVETAPVAETNEPMFNTSNSDDDLPF